uniref:Uncharacterized protein n=1 Tax=viral metagenome TaxID=1070528 RepID=A0A6C0KJV8_9ZZZZ
MPGLNQPLSTDSTGFPAAMKPVLARLAAADILMSGSATVYEISAIIKDLVAVCGPETTFQALAQHINDVYIGDTSTGGNYTVAYYNGSYSSDLIKNLSSGTAFSQGQEVALTMFIRAELDIGVMVKVITYGQLIAFIHKRASDSSETGLGNKLKSSRVSQYDISTLVGTSGYSSFIFTTQDATSADLLYAIGEDTSAGTSVTPTVSVNYRLWLLSKVTAPTHSIRTLSALTLSNYLKWNTTTYVAVQGTSDSVFDYTVKLTTSTAAGALFTVSNVITYILTTSKTSSFNHNNTAIYINNASSTTFGTTNYDKLISDDNVKTLSPTTLKAGGATFSQLKSLNFALNTLIALNNSNTIFITLGDAKGVWQDAEIAASDFTFSDKTAAGTNFQYYIISTDAKNNGDLLADLIGLYGSIKLTNTNSNTFVNGVDAAYARVSGLQSDPAGPKAVAIGVLAWLFSHLESFTAPGSRDPTKIMLANGLSTSIQFYRAFLGATAVSGLGISLFDLFETATIAYSTDGYAIDSGFSSFELKTYFSITPGIARDNNWSPALISNTYTPSEIFNLQNKRRLPTHTTEYALSVVEALLGYNVASSNAFFKVDSSSTTDVVIGTGTARNPMTYRFNYDAIPYETLSKLLLPSQILADIQSAISNASSGAAFSGNNYLNLTTAFPKLTLSSSNISAFLDALALPFDVAASLIGTSYGTNSKIALVDLAATTIYSKTERRKLFHDLSDAASQYAKSGLSVKSLVALGFGSAEWKSYAAPENMNNRSIVISVRDVLGATETVTEFDDDFYTTANATKAVIDDVNERIAILKAFDNTMSDVVAAKLARGPPQNLPHLVL